MGDQRVVSLLKQFSKLQEERAMLYSKFQLGHREYLKNRQESTITSLMSQLTSDFSRVSQQVNSIEQQLKSPVDQGGAGRPDLASVLRSVQEKEREKLALTLQLQALKQAGAFRGYGQASTAGQHQPQQHGHSCSLHGHHVCDHDHDVEEPSEEEYTAAVREAMRELNSIVESINDSLETVRYTVAELEGAL